MLRIGLWFLSYCLSKAKAKFKHGVLKLIVTKVKKAERESWIAMAVLLLSLSREYNLSVVGVIWFIFQWSRRYFTEQFFVLIINGIIVLYQIAADFIVLLHFIFIVFVVSGGLLVFNWRWLIWPHMAAAIWGSLIVMAGWICPLTPIENWLRLAAGDEVYSGSFIERYLIPVIYPSSLDREMSITMGIVVIVVNVIVYAILFIRLKRNV